MELIDRDDMVKSLMDMTFYDEEGHVIDDYEDRLAIVKSFVDPVQTVDVIPVQWLYDLAEKKEEEKDIKLSTMVKGVVALWHMEKRNEKRNNCKELVATET